MSASNLTEDDEGKRVVTGDGETVGMITEVRGGTAHVDPDPDMLDTMKAKLDWGDSPDETYPIDSSQIADVTDDEVRIS